jgi:hypothetical protein
MGCLNCGKLLSPSKSRKKLGYKKYCDNACQQEYQTHVKMQNFLDGKYVGTLGSNPI